MSEVENLIYAQVEALLQSSEFVEWFQGQRIKPNDWVVFNNSFMYRDKSKIKTKKSTLYLAIRADSRGRLSPTNLYVVQRKVRHTEDSKQIADVKHLPGSTAGFSSIEPIVVAVPKAVDSLGKLVFLLIAEIQDTLVLRETISCGPFTELVLDPQTTEPLRIEGSTITISHCSDARPLWEDLNRLGLERGLLVRPFGHKERDSFAGAIERLSKAEYARLTLPVPHVHSDKTLLDQIAVAIGNETVSYCHSLDKCAGQPSSEADFNNVLRIAYNFASEANTLIALLMSVCDLKPVVFWCTIHSHWKLRQAFQRLPWASLNVKKPSLSAYEQSVKGARNSAFHHLLPISKTLIADLRDVPLKARSLRLFRKYGTKKAGNELDYEDKELVEVLTQFTRAEESTVGPDFWIHNRDVMQNAADLASTTAHALKTLLAYAGA